jgi:hypothetical protein
MNSKEKVFLLQVHFHIISVWLLTHENLGKCIKQNKVERLKKKKFCFVFVFVRVNADENQT